MKKYLDISDENSLTEPADILAKCCEIQTIAIAEKFIDTMDELIENNCSCCGKE